MDTTPIYFWRETGQHGYLSQLWTADPFRSDPRPDDAPPITFKTAEHYMMHGKAVLFNDEAAALAILKADHPRKVKALGRRVKGFDEARWNEDRERIVREGSVLKFRGSDELRGKLLATGDRELVEASPLDRIWGIGFSPDKAPASDRSLWGLNLLGKVLMEVRAQLREEDGEKEKRKKEEGGEKEDEEREEEEKETKIQKGKID